MDDRTRQFARCHWSALDAAMTRGLASEQRDMCRAAFRWSADELIATYARQLADPDHQVQLLDASRELTAWLTTEWESATSTRQTGASGARR